MPKEKCIFLREESHGMQVFWYTPCESGDIDFDAEYVRVFIRENAPEPFIRLHRSRIIPLGPDVETEEKSGLLYPTVRWMGKLQSQWSEQRDA